MPHQRQGGLDSVGYVAAANLQRQGVRVTQGCPWSLGPSNPHLHDRFFDLPNRVTTSYTPVRTEADRTGPPAANAGKFTVASLAEN